MARVATSVTARHAVPETPVAGHLQSAALFLCLALPLAALAQTYRWVDEKGQVHYSQIPPRNQQYKSIGPAPPPAAAPNQDALNKSLDDSVKDAPKQQEAAAKAELQRAQRQDRCKKAIESLAYLEAQTPRRLAKTDSKGEVSRVTEEQFEQSKAAQQRGIKDNCD